MSCQICYNDFDHSRHKPYSLSNCPHTFCISCLNRLTSNKCPNCNVEIKDKHPNLSLLELIPQSAYDKTKKELEKVLIETSDLRKQLNLSYGKKIIEQLNKTNCLKVLITKKSNEIIASIKLNASNMLQEVEYYESSIQNSLHNLYLDVDAKTITNAKTNLESNGYDEVQIKKMEHNFQVIKQKLNERIIEMDEFNENLHLLSNNIIFSKKGVFGQIKDIEKKPEEYHRIANDLFEHDKYAEAVYFYNKGIKSKPDSKELFSLYIDKAASLWELDRFNEVLECYNQAINIDSNNGLSHYYKGKTLVVLNLHVEAMDSFRKAVDLEHKNPLFLTAYLKNQEIYKKQLRALNAENIEPRSKRLRVKNESSN